MSDITINNLPLAATIDGSLDFLPIYTASSAATQRISRNTFLNIASNPVGISDSQTLTNKAITAPTISSPVLSGTITGTYTIGGTPTFPSSVVTLTGSQTLTNKVLTSPTINAPTITNATITADAITGFSSSSTGTIYGISVTSGAISGSVLSAASVASSKLTSVDVSAVSVSNPYKFYVRRNAAANTGNAAFAKITFDTENFDTNNNFATGTYTAPVNGFYQFNWFGQTTTNSTNQTFILSLYKNGAEIVRGNRLFSPSTAVVLGAVGSALIQLSANDTVEVYAFATTALALFVTDTPANGTQPYFMGYLVSQT